MSRGNRHLRSTLDDFLHEEGIYEAAKTEAAHNNHAGGYAR